MDIFGQKDLTDSPCIGVCSTSFGDEVYVGCGRRFDEVCRWNIMDDDEKRAVNLRLYQEREATKSK